MWVLSTDRAELHYFTNPAAIPGGYAILSHTWAQSPDREETFQDVQKINRQYRDTEENPRDHVGKKARQCCKIARRDGYKWVWIDSCCINKESSAELSEAINSMFNWYALAEVCYVFLEDVRAEDDPFAMDSEFRRARWHARGWTLQELLAPVFVVFLSQKWTQIGNKYDLRVPLSECTGINTEYLTRERDFRVDASIATRMSWAASRKTTRVEDEAYCLLGLFDVNMPTLYGEGRQAFQRLQAELIKSHIDTSLFVWGHWYNSSHDQNEQASLSLVHNSFHNPDVPPIYLFAPSPSHFSGKSNAYQTPQSQTGAEHPSFELTPYGMKCRFPVAEVDGITIAILVCQTDSEYLGLLLHPALGDKVLDSSRTLYYVSWAFRLPNGSLYRGRRVACLGGDLYNLRFRGNPVEPEWRDIYIMAHPPTSGRTDGAHFLQRFRPDIALTPFRIPRTLLQSLGALGFLLDSWTINKDPASTDVISLTCENTAVMEGFRVLLGSCMRASTGGSHPCHWAWVEHYHRATWRRTWTKVAHDCATDHISDWDNCEREFGDTERTIRLVFEPCPHIPQRTLVFGLELAGNVYDKIQKDANVYLPPAHHSPPPPSPSPSRSSTSTHTAPTHPDLSVGSRGGTLHISSPPPVDSHNGDVQEQIRQVSDSVQNAHVTGVTELNGLIHNLQVLHSRLLSSLDSQHMGPARSPTPQLHQTSNPPPVVNENTSRRPQETTRCGGSRPASHGEKARASRASPASTQRASSPLGGPSLVEKPKSRVFRRFLCLDHFMDT